MRREFPLDVTCDLPTQLSGPAKETFGTKRYPLDTADPRPPQSAKPDAHLGVVGGE